MTTSPPDLLLETPRLWLVATPLHVIQTRLACAHFRAPLPTPEGPQEVTFPPDWPGAPLAYFPEWAASFDAAAPAWDGTLVRRADRLAVGQMGFKGGPDAGGTIELGYGLIPGARGLGYATEMGRALTAWGKARPGVRRVTAKTRTDNAASIRVLEKLGFVRAGGEFDPEDGELIVWEWPSPAQGAP